MVDDFQDLRLLEAGHGLRDLVVIDQNDALAARLDEVIPGKRTHDLLVLVEDRIAAVTAFQDDLLHVVHEVGQMERLKLLRPADALDGNGMKDHPRSLKGVVGRGDDAGVRRRIAQILRQLRLTDD